MFFTGKAGSGKTVVLKEVVSYVVNQMKKVLSYAVQVMAVIFLRKRPHFILSLDKTLPEGAMVL